MNEQNVFYPRYEVADFTPGVVREHQFVIDKEQVNFFSNVSEDHHPLHTDVSFSQARGYTDIVVHGMLVASRSSAFIAREFVGSHGLLVSISSDFRQPVFCDMPLVWQGEVERVFADAGTVEIQWKVINDSQIVMQCGTACALLPRPL